MLYLITISKNEKYNLIVRTRGKQTINNVEIQAVEHTLIIQPIDKNLIIWTDSEFVLSDSNRFKEKTEEKKII